MEAKVVDKLAKQGIKKDDLTREQFEQEMQVWYKENGEFIINQIKSLGVMADWDELCFTRDEVRNKAVTHAFVELWKKGLIYRGERLTNWCPKCNTSISDIEVDYREKNAAIYHIKYQVANSEDYLVVATTRPETLFGDLAVAVNPLDARYTRFIGKEVVLPIVNKKIPVIVANDGDVTALAGLLELKTNEGILGIAMGTSQAGGYNPRCK